MTDHNLPFSEFILHMSIQGSLVDSDSCWLSCVPLEHSHEQLQLEELEELEELELPFKSPAMKPTIKIPRGFPPATTAVSSTVRVRAPAGKGLKVTLCIGHSPLNE